MSLAIGATALPAHAQFSRLADEIEVKRLDFHPRPSLRKEIGAQIYGVLDLGIATGRDEPGQERGKDVPNPDLRMAGIGPSFLGIRSDALLDGGARAHAQLEHGFGADTGQPKANCKPFWNPAVEHGTLAPTGHRTRCTGFWDRRASVGLSHRLYGRVDIGLLEQPARQIAFMASPWGADSVASPQEKRLYVPNPNEELTLPGLSSQAITYESPYSLNYKLQLHASLSRRPTLPGGGDAGTAEQYGAAFTVKLGALEAGIGWQRWEGRNHTLPLAVQYQLGNWRAHAGLTVGQRTGRDFHNVFVGASYRERSGPRPGEIRLGLNVFEMDGQTRQWKVGAGYEYPFSRRTALQANVGVRSSDPVASRVRVDVGMRHAFSL